MGTCTKCCLSESTGNHAWCQHCQTVYTARSRLDPAKRQKHSDAESARGKSIAGQRARVARTCRGHGITIEEFARLFAQQGGACAICRAVLRLDRFTHIDHDHTTGRVRGLLCQRCNLVLGHAMDSPATLRSAADYLERL